MKFGLAFASSVGTDPSSALEICRQAEQAGFDSVWGGEHVIRPAKISLRSHTFLRLLKNAMLTLPPSPRKT